MNAVAAAGALPPVVHVGRETPAALRAMLAQAGVRLNPLAEQLFGDTRFEVPAQSRPFAVAAVHVGALVHAEDATFETIARSAARQGLQPCPLALAPWLRLQWLNQPEAPAGAPSARHRAPPGAVTVASEPPPDAPDLPWGFYLRRIDGVPWLRGYRCWSGHVWAPEDVLVFRQMPAAGSPDEITTSPTPP
ncbi:MAG: hypothetical protein KDG57_15540 [Rhodoferax sp.]|nr:hypothetical protein [Rhodoferax sp.]